MHFLVEAMSGSILLSSDHSPIIGVGFLAKVATKPPAKITFRKIKNPSSRLAASTIRADCNAEIE